MADFIAGHLVPVNWTVFGGAGVLHEFNVKDHSLDISVLLHDVTGVKANGLRARIAGPTDIAGRIVCDRDLDESPWEAPALLRAGNSGVALFGVDDTGDFVQCPVICEKFHMAGATDREMMWDADWKCNSLRGFLVYPAL